MTHGDPMTAERCPRCDLPVADEESSVPPVDAQDVRLCFLEGGIHCRRRAVDWRARALAAEEKADAYQRDWYGAKAEFGAARARLRADAARAERERVVALVLADVPKLEDWMARAKAEAARAWSDGHVGASNCADTEAAALATRIRSLRALADAIERGDHAKGGT